jgi:hypothetical protein
MLTLETLALLGQHGNRMDFVAEVMPRVEWRR